MRPIARWIDRILDTLTDLLEDIRDGLRARAAQPIPVRVRPTVRRRG